MGEREGRSGKGGKERECREVRDGSGGKVQEGMLQNQSSMCDKAGTGCKLCYYKDPGVTIS